VDNALRDAKLQFKDIDEVILVGGSTRIPAVQELVKKMTGKDPNVTVNPDEVVALGAAVQVSSQATLVWLTNLCLEVCYQTCHNAVLRMVFSQNSVQTIEMRTLHCPCWQILEMSNALVYVVAWSYSYIALWYVFLSAKFFTAGWSFVW